MREVNEDKFCTIRERDYKLFRTKYCPVHHSILEFSEEDFANAFWALWLGNLEDDVKKLHRIKQHHKRCKNVTCTMVQ